MTNWQNTALDDAARRFPVRGQSKDERDIYISMSSKNQGILRLPAGTKNPKGFMKIKVLGKIKVPKKSLIDSIIIMKDENYKYNYDGYHCYHIDRRDFERAAIIESGNPVFHQSGNYFSSDIAHHMITISCDEFVDHDELFEIGGVPATSDFSDARHEAEECGEEPQDWIDDMMKTAEENIRACLRSVILFDEVVEGDEIEAVLIDYIGE